MDRRSAVLQLFGLIASIPCLFNRKKEESFYTGPEKESEPEIVLNDVWAYRTVGANCDGPGHPTVEYRNWIKVRFFELKRGELFTMYQPTEQSGVSYGYTVDSEPYLNENGIWGVAVIDKCFVYVMCGRPTNIMQDRNPKYTKPLGELSKAKILT